MIYSNERTVKVSCGKQDFYNFVTDIRNFGRFIPESLRQGWNASEEKCSFSLSGMGEMNIGISEKIPEEKVVFSGTALSKISFIIETIITGGAEVNSCDVQVTLRAEMDRLTGIIAKPQLDAVFGAIVNEMENFSGWND